MDAPTLHLFDELQANLFDWSISNIYQSFLKSSQYYEYLGNFQLSLNFHLFTPYHLLGKPNPYEKVVVEEDDEGIEENHEPPVSPSRRSGWFNCLGSTAAP